jgi:serine/threonine protein kinase/tetratricopeptide (TPR) repeat protein
VTNESVDPLIDRTVAHYQILAKLGGGGMGVVYQARDTRLGRVVALKFLPHQWSHDADARLRFVREAQAASATDHRNICTVHDIATADDGQLFIVMAYYAGPTLKQRLEAGALPVDEALDIATQIAEGLARAHAHGVVHRDVKPGNVILAEDGVRIVDFGLATFADALQLTVAGSTLGTAAYMSPEQVRGDAVDARTDVWAAGVILYQMLAGHPPFRGAYADAIAYAIRHDAPPPLRETRPEVPEDVELLVVRALHKDPAVRYQSGRELARALRQVRGLTVPVDLRTEPVAAPSSAAARRPRGRRASRPLWIGATVVLLPLLVVAGWTLRPVDRISVVIVPVANLTGFADLQPYRRALTQSMVQDLTTSMTVRPVSWTRTQQTLRGFIARDADISSREVESALTRETGAQIAILPTLMFEDRAWRVRVEVRDARTSTNIADYKSEPVVSALRRETAYTLIRTAVELVDAHFQERGPRGWFAGRRPSTRLATLDAAAAFEEGLNWYDEQEYPSAYRSFVEAAALDSSSPLASAWASRAARLMRHDGEAVEFGDRAVRLLTAGTPVSVRLFVEAVDGEATRQQSTAEARLRDLMREYPDDVSGVVELAAFQDRHASTRSEWQAAVATYHDSLTLDAGLVRPHLELCRLYASLQELQRAKEHGERAFAAYRTGGWRGGEALARFCLVDVLRGGDAGDQQQAQQHAQAALTTLTALGFSYNIPRALSYLGLAAAPQGRLNEAVAYWEQASAAAESSGNAVLQPSLLTNLGVAHQRLGRGSRATEFYNRSATLYEGLGDERRAARQQYNSAVLRISYGIAPDQAASDIENALEVVRKQGDADFEVACMETMGAYFRHSGRFTEAERTLHQALSLARQHNLEQKISSVQVEFARLWLEKAEYGRARDLLVAEIAKSEGGRAASRLQILLGRVHTRLGDVTAARSSFLAVRADLESRSDGGLRPILDEAMGELAYESGQADQAAAYFTSVAGAGDDAFVEPEAIEARAYLGLLSALRGSVSSGRQLVQASLDHAIRMRRAALETRSRIFLARIHLLERTPDLALRVLADAVVPGREIGLELQAQVHYWRSRAIMTPAEAAGEAALARNCLEQLGVLVPRSHADAFRSRRDLRVILE